MAEIDELKMRASISLKHVESFQHVLIPATCEKQHFPQSSYCVVQMCCDIDQLLISDIILSFYPDAGIFQD